MRTIKAKVAQLLPRVFKGRREAYATKYISSSGKTSYSFVCQNNFKRGVCPKPDLLEAKKSLKGVCKKCDQKRYMAWDWITVSQHLDGKHCMGLYVLNPNATCQFGVIDLDDKEGTALLEKAPMIVGSQLVDKAREYGLTLFLEKSGGGMGSHVWCLLTVPVRAKRMRELLTGLVRAAWFSPRKEVGFTHLKDMEVFPKQGTIGPDGLGNLVALPFQGPEKMKAGASMFYDPDSLLPLVTARDEGSSLRGVYQLLLEMMRDRTTPEEFKAAYAQLRAEGNIVDKPKRAAGSRPRRQIKGVELDQSSTPDPGAYLKSPVEAVFKGCEALGQFQQVGQGKAKGDGRDGLRHQQRLFMAGVLRGLPGGREAIHEVIGGGCPDYDSRTTDEYIDSLTHGPWLCTTAQEHGVCPFTGPCPAIEARGGRSPVAFAFKKKKAGEEAQCKWTLRRKERRRQREREAAEARWAKGVK